MGFAADYKLLGRASTGADTWLTPKTTHGFLAWKFDYSLHSTVHLQHFHSMSFGAALCRDYDRLMK